MPWVEKGTGRKVSDDDPDVKRNPHKYVSHGEAYRKQQREKARRQQADRRKRKR